jgi:hypothetical protein
VKKLALIISLILVLLLLIGCSNSIAGTYIGESDSSSYPRLESDGTFITGLISGKYNVQENELQLLPINTFAEDVTFKIDGNKITPVREYLLF